MAVAQIGEWQVVAASVRGAMHERTGKPNQDAFATRSAGDPAPALAVAVSDGHGSASCFRSGAGASLAVDVATRLMSTFAGAQPPGQSPANVRHACEHLPETLVGQWREAVEQILAKEALSVEELSTLERQSGPAARLAVEKNPLIAYGATLLSVLVADSFVLYLQLGDGDILTVADSGEVRRPLPGDHRLLGNATTSLCSDGSWRAARFDLQVPAEERPALILLSSDGYANSFAQDPDFLKIGTDLLHMVRTAGLDTVRDNLSSWLAETSAAGSGDDITLAMICRPDMDAAGSSRL